MYSYKNFIVTKNNYLLQLAEIIELNKIDFFFPVINDSLSQFWFNKEKFGPSLNYLGDYSSYEILNGKDKRYPEDKYDRLSRQDRDSSFYWQL